MRYELSLGRALGRAFAMIGHEPKHRRSVFSSISRSLQIIAGAVLVLIVAATAHQLMTIRAAVVADTARQMARLDMVFAEQTGRAVETVDFILRNAIETYQMQRAQAKSTGGTL